MARYLVTGGAGFIGSHLVDRLLADGHTVVALDNLSTGKLENLRNALENPNLNFVHGSVLDELLVDELMHVSEAVFHLAAAVGVRLIVDQPLRSLTTNIRGSEIVIEAAYRHRCRILLTSTSEIYGKNSSGPLTESSDRILGAPTVARWAYSAAKGIDEVLASAYHKERGLPTTIVRLFNTAGPRQSAAYGMVIPRFVRQALRGDPLTVYGTGTQTRCFCHVADVIEVLVSLMKSDVAIGEVFNVGSQEEISMSSLATRIIASVNSTSSIELIPYDEAFEVGFEDMERRVPDTNKIESAIGWRTTRSLDAILDESIADARLEEQGQAVRPGI